MHNPNLLRALSILIIVGLGAGMAPLPSGTGQAAQEMTSPEIATRTNTGEVFLPLIARKAPLVTTVFGVEMHSINEAGGLYQIANADATWVRRNGLLWSLVEKDEGQYDWSHPYIAALEQELQNAAQHGMEVILVVRSTPAWAQQIPGYSCGPVREEKLVAFGNFMAEAVLRYGAPPYNVKYWQIWNEPDVSYDGGFAPNHPFGCWGDAQDTQFYGGGYYAAMLKAVYPRIKQADPSAQVLLGGLLLICNPQYCNQLAARFLEGVLANGGGDYFDALAFHAYDFYSGSIGRYGNIAWQTRSEEVGPVLIAKAKFLRSMLKKYGYEDKKIMNTEGALICGSTGKEAMCLSEHFELTKAYYIAQIFAAAIAEGLEANIWYSVQGWRRSELLDANMKPGYAYDAFKFARAKLNNAAYSRNIDMYEGVGGWELTNANGRVWVIWSKSAESPQSILLPGTPLKVWDAVGNSVPVTGSSLTVTEKTLYVEWPNQ